MLSIDDQALETAFWWSGLHDPEYPVEHLGELCADLCKRLRTLAISQLLQEGKNNSFFHNLIRSGKVREGYLSRAVASKLAPDYLRCSGRYDPLLDAMAANEFALARQIVKVSLTEMLEGHEYPDDYHYAQGLHRLILNDSLGCETIVEKFDICLEGENSPRRDLLKSLSRRNQNDFDTAFKMLLEDREREIAANIARGQFADLYVSTARSIFIEGLAILRLAEKFQLVTEDEYLFCPSMARTAMTEPFPGE